MTGHGGHDPKKITRPQELATRLLNHLHLLGNSDPSLVDDIKPVGIDLPFEEYIRTPVKFDKRKLQRIRHAFLSLLLREL
jgi:hypothetical protein